MREHLKLESFDGGGAITEQECSDDVSIHRVDGRSLRAKQLESYIKGLTDWDSFRTVLSAHAPLNISQLGRSNMSINFLSKRYDGRTCSLLQVTGNIQLDPLAGNPAN